MALEHLNNCLKFYHYYQFSIVEVRLQKNWLRFLFTTCELHASYLITLNMKLPYLL